MSGAARSPASPAERLDEHTRQRLASRAGTRDYGHRQVVVILFLGKPIFGAAKRTDRTPCGSDDWVHTR
jgi:hypothetical protein